MGDEAAILSLESFPSIPRAGKITVAESHSELHALSSTPSHPITAVGFCPSIVQYTAVDGNQLTSRLPFKIPSVRISSGKASFVISKHQSIPKALWDSWWEHGLHGIYDCLSEAAEKSSTLGNSSKSALKLFAGVAGICVQICEAPSKFLGFLFPHLEWKIEEVNEEFSRVRRWKESWVRAMAWHPTIPVLALGMNDDTVRCCVVGKEVVPMLRHQQQRNICCLAWRPYVTTEMAVGCEDCIVIWYLTSYVSMKPGKDKSVVLKVPGHSPVTSVEYSADAIYLLSSSAKDSTVLLWDACMWTKAPLKRIGGGGIPLSLWSPAGNRIVAVSPTKKFWIWERSEFWKSKLWETPLTKIEAAAWHPEGATLVFAAGGCLYGLFFELSPVDRFVAQKDALVKLIFNIEESHKLDEDGNLEYKIGGKVRQIQWDPSGHRLALLFDDSEMVAVFRVLNRSRADLLAPLGFIRGHPDESPMAISFQNDFQEGALLTIAWSTGRIQYFPMIFALPSDRKNIMHEDHYRTQQVIHGQPSSFAAAGFVSPRLSVSGLESSALNISRLFGGQEEATSPTSRLYSVPKDLDN